MIVLVQANVLTVGLNGENEVLRELPIRLLAMQSASEAVRSLKNEPGGIDNPFLGGYEND